MHNLLLSLYFVVVFFVFYFYIFVLPLGEVDYYVTVSVKVLHCKYHQHCPILTRNVHLSVSYLATGYKDGGKQRHEMLSL